MTISRQIRLGGEKPIAAPDRSLPLEGLDNVWIVLPTFNEVDNIGGLVLELRRIVPSAMILVVDDSSPDGTAAVMEDLSSRDPRMRLLLRTGSRGLGSALLAGLQVALREAADAVVTMDADLSHDPRDVPRLLAALEGADVAIGSRYVQGGQTVGWPWRRRLLSAVANLYARCVLHLEQRDCSSGFRAYMAGGLDLLLTNATDCVGYVFHEAMLFHAAAAGLRVVEIPIVFRDRRRGRSKMGLGEAWDGARILWGLTRDSPNRPLLRRSRTNFLRPRKRGRSH